MNWLVLLTAAASLLTTGNSQQKSDRSSVLQAGQTGAPERGSKPDPEAWYASRINFDKRALVAEFELPAGKSFNLEVPAEGKDEIGIYFRCDRGLELERARKGTDQAGAIEMRSLSVKESVRSNIGGGMEFTARGGKVKLKVTNRSDLDVRIAVTTDR